MSDKVSIHALVRVRPDDGKTVYLTPQFQSTHSRECDGLDAYGLSINSATGVLRQPPMEVHIFQAVKKR